MDLIPQNGPCRSIKWDDAENLIRNMYASNSGWIEIKMNSGTKKISSKRF
jgi:hypothetical protein